jgi:HK97 family phage portal protein
VGLFSYLRGDHIDLQLDQGENRTLERPTVPQNIWDAWVPRQRPLRQVTRENALAVATAWSCVKLLADSISTLPLRIYRRQADGSRIPAGPDQRLAQLLARPWPGATSIDLISMIVMHLSLFGEAWIAKYTSEGSIIGLGLIHPSRMQIYMVGNTVTYALDGDNSYGPADIILIRGLCLNGLRGISPVQSVANAFELNENLRESSRQFFMEGSRPSGILKAPEGASEKAIKALQEDWRNLYSGAGGIEHMHKVAVLSADMDFTPISFSLSDQKFLASREFSTREVAAIFGLPAWAINGDSGSSLTYANTTQQAQFLVQHSFRPLTARIETALSSDPSLCPGGVYASFDFSELLRGSPNERADFYTKALGTDKAPGWMSRAEVRAQEDLPPEQETSAVGGGVPIGGNTP